MVPKYVCPRCLIGNVTEIPGEEDDGTDVDCCSCDDCGFFAIAEDFRIYGPEDMPEASPTPLGESFYGTPIEEGIVFWLEKFVDDDGESKLVVTNIPHYFDSGGTFMWGYLGTGPAVFALNIIETVLRYRNYHGPKLNMSEFPGHKGGCFKVSWDLHHKLKQEIISRCSQDFTGRIDLNAIEEWLRHKGVSVLS